MPAANAIIIANYSKLLKGLPATFYQQSSMTTVIIITKETITNS